MTNKQNPMPKRNIYCKISLQLLVFGDFDGSLLIARDNLGWTLTIVKIWDDGMVNGFRVTSFGLDGMVMFLVSNYRSKNPFKSNGLNG